MFSVVNAEVLEDSLSSFPERRGVEARREIRYIFVSSQRIHNLPRLLQSSESKLTFVAQHSEHLGVMPPDKAGRVVFIGNIPYGKIFAGQSRALDSLVT